MPRNGLTENLLTAEESGRAAGKPAPPGILSKTRWMLLG